MATELQHCCIVCSVMPCCAVLCCAVLQAVVAEADDADYWFHASRDGNREKHYRYAVCSRLCIDVCCRSGSITLLAGL
jgi:hypothetical protein